MDLPIHNPVPSHAGCVAHPAPTDALEDINGPESAKDSAIRRNIEAELQWDPQIDDRRILVTVHQGIVTLRGTVPTVASIRTAEDVARSAEGVLAIANELNISAPGLEDDEDSRLASKAAEHLALNLVTRSARITPIVKRGRVVLVGVVTWPFQRTAAERCIAGLSGVRQVHNLIRVKSKIHLLALRRRIERYTEQGQPAGNDIKIVLNGRAVTLCGHAGTRAQMDRAVSAAWSVPGVLSVENRLRLQ